MNDYHRIAQVIRFLDSHRQEQPSLNTLAEQVQLSPFHFHRMFAKWAGVTPKEFLRCLTVAHARNALLEGTSVMETAFEVGLSGPGRLHDLCVNLESASPGEIKSGGKGWTIRTAFADTPFGPCLIGVSPRGICHLSFVNSDDLAVETIALRELWPNAEIEWDDGVASIASDIFERRPDGDRAPSLQVVVKGTRFQVQVWRALLRIPIGKLTSYGNVAHALGKQTAARAVGSAVGANQIAYLVPCHRVIRETGVVGEYRWDATRKRAILAWEAATGRQSLDSNCCR